MIRSIEKNMDVDIIKKVKTEQKWKICDCFEGLPEIPDKSVDMILTDLPYGVTDCSWDNTLKLDCLWAEYRRIIRDNGVIVLTATQPFTSILVMSAPDLFKYEWIWYKNTCFFLHAKSQPLREHENILVFYKNAPKYYPIMDKRSSEGFKRVQSKYNSNTRMGEGLCSNLKIATVKDKEYPDTRYPSSIQFFNNRTIDRGLHPSQKPIEMFEYLIKTYTNEGDMVHDSCLGSGTTLEACMRLNRNCIGFEIDPQWEPIYKKRLKLDRIPVKLIEEVGNL